MNNIIYDLNLSIRKKLKSCGNGQDCLHMQDVADFLKIKKRTIEQSFYYGRKLKLDEFLKIIHIISIYTNESPQDLMDEFLESSEYWKEMNKEHLQRQKLLRERTKRLFKGTK